MTFALVRDGEITLTMGYGYADLATHEHVDPARHLFRPGSVSKLFTWTAVMQLVEQGKTSLSEDVSKYVQQFDIPNEFNTPLTLTHIMSHAPGLEDGGAGFLFGDEPSDNTSLAEALAGLVVANVSGMSFENYVRENIFISLNMQHLALSTLKISVQPVRCLPAPMIWHCSCWPILTTAATLAILGSVCTFIALLFLLPVWRAEDCGIWARIRYTYVTTVFVLFVLVLHFWNMLGWRY